MIDLTEGVASIVESSRVRIGVVSVFVPGSTAAITAMEHEPGGVEDLRAALERLIPAEGDYRAQRAQRRHATRTPTSAPRSSGRRRRSRSATGKLELGTWQQIVLVDFDDRPRQRTVVVQVLG